MVIPMTNRAVVYAGECKVQVRDMGTPRMLNPNTQESYAHGCILKVIASLICGSDNHMYHGRTDYPVGSILGHEVTGEVIDCGSEVKTIRPGDIVSVPFNVACGMCQNCIKGNTQICLRVNKQMPGGIYGYAMMGGWPGGQAEYFSVAYADFNLVKIPNRTLAMEKLFDLCLLSDTLPTAYHSAKMANVSLGKTVYIAGAGPIGTCCAAVCKKLLGASRVIVGDVNPSRLQSVSQMGCDVIDLSRESNVCAAIKNILGFKYPYVDCAIDCVGMECHGHGATHCHEEIQTQVLHSLIDCVDFGGSIYICGVYLPSDRKGADKMSKHGFLQFPIGLAFAKGLSISSGQCPVSRYNSDLMMCIINGSFSVYEYLNLKVVGLDDMPRAYEMFTKGDPSKYILDPHGIIRNYFADRHVSNVQFC